MIKLSFRTKLLVGLGLLALAWFVAVWQPWQARDRSQTGLVDLHDIETLQTRFNADAGNARLFLIVAPT